MTPLTATEAIIDMKQTLYSRILLIVSGILLAIAAVFSYTAAIRVFPLYSFAGQVTFPDPTEPFRRLMIPIIGLSICVLLLGKLYHLFSPQTTVLVVCSALVLPAMHLLGNDFDEYASRYLFPSLIFWLYPLAVSSVLRDTVKPSAHRSIAVRFQIGFAVLCALVLFLLSILALTPHVLFLQLLLLVLAPFLPVLLEGFALFSRFGIPLSHAMLILLRLMCAILPLSAAIRPFSFAGSLWIARIGIPVIFLAMILLFFIPPLRKRCISASHG